MIIPLRNGVTLVGFRAFYHYRLLKKSNQNRIRRRLCRFREKLGQGKITKEHTLLSMAGWQGYAMMGNTYGLRQEVHREA